MVLELPNKSQRVEALKNLPPGLTTTFQGIINRIQKSLHAKLGLQVLMWLHFAYRPLKLAELQHALAVEKVHKEFNSKNITSQEVLLSCCFGLVVVDKETSTVRFAHYTIKEYFGKHTPEEFSDGCSSIAETCLTYLNFGALKQHCTSLDDLESKKLDYALLDYAALYWGKYFKKQCNDDLMRLAKMLVDHEDEHPPCAIQALYPKLSAYRSPRYLEACQKFSGIHVTAYFGLSKTMEYLCEVRRDIVELKDEFGRTPLSWAAKEGHKAVVELLIEGKGKDIDINVKDRDGRTPLMGG